MGKNKSKIKEVFSIIFRVLIGIGAFILYAFINSLSEIKGGTEISVSILFIFMIISLYIFLIKLLRKSSISKETENYCDRKWYHKSKTWASIIFVLIFSLSMLIIEKNIISISITSILIALSISMLFIPRIASPIIALYIITEIVLLFTNESLDLKTIILALLIRGAYLLLCIRVFLVANKLNHGKGLKTTPKKKGEKTLKELYAPKKNFITKKKVLLITPIVLILFSIGIILSGYSSLIIGIFPPLKISEKTTTLTCKYGGKDLKLTVSLYKNIYNYYHYNSKKVGVVGKGLYSNFVYVNNSDLIIKDLASKIRNLGKGYNLNDDQIMELALCFVQNIPYDSSKAETILSGQNISEYDRSQYPYETIFKNSGICTDKAYLGSSLLRELGYSSALLLFGDDNHMALGVKVNKDYANFNSDYAIAEVTTPGFIPGDLPKDIDDNDGKPSLVLELPQKLGHNNKINTQKFLAESDLSYPTVVIPISDGKTYERIRNVKHLEAMIYQGIEELEEIAHSIETMEYDLIDAEDNASYAYNDYLNQPDYNQRCGTRWDYLNDIQWWDCWEEENMTKTYFWNVYQERINYYNSLVDKYNSLIDDYNYKIDDINYLIDKRNSYQFN